MTYDEVCKASYREIHDEVVRLDELMDLYWSLNPAVDQEVRDHARMLWAEFRSKYGVTSYSKHAAIMAKHAPAKEQQPVLK